MLKILEKQKKAHRREIKFDLFQGEKSVLDTLTQEQIATLGRNVRRDGQFVVKPIRARNTGMETRDKVNADFVLAIRPLYIRYLAKIEQKSLLGVFSKDQIYHMKMSRVPHGWSLHHQHSMYLGGGNMNPAAERKVRAIQLTPEQISELWRNRIYRGPENPEKAEKQKEVIMKHWPSAVLKKKLDIYLKRQESRGRLAAAFDELFGGVVVLIPTLEHEYLEKEVIDPQKDMFDDSFEERSKSNTIECTCHLWITRQRVYGIPVKQRAKRTKCKNGDRLPLPKPEQKPKAEKQPCRIRLFPSLDRRDFRHVLTECQIKHIAE